MYNLKYSIYMFSLCKIQVCSLSSVTVVWISMFSNPTMWTTLASSEESEKLLRSHMELVWFDPGNLLRPPTRVTRWPPLSPPVAVGQDQLIAPIVGIVIVALIVVLTWGPWRSVSATFSVLCRLGAAKRNTFPLMVGRWITQKPSG